MIDNYGRVIDYMRISVTELCNLRCRYCMPEEGIVKRAHEEMMTAEETIDAVKAAVSLGIKKIRITGGEPLVKKGIVRLCSAISAIEGVEELCITTNGTLLPKFGKELREAGVSRVNISLDTLDPDKYREITRVGELSEALTGIDAAFEAGFDNIKINNVLMGGFNDDEIEEIGGQRRVGRQFHHIPFVMTHTGIFVFFGIRIGVSSQQRIEPLDRTDDDARARIDRAIRQLLDPEDFGEGLAAFCQLEGLEFCSGSRSKIVAVHEKEHVLHRREGQHPVCHHACCKGLS